MQEYKSFIFDGYKFDEATGLLEMSYRLDDSIAFVETVRFPLKGMHYKKVDPVLLDRAFFALHLIGGISYFKTCCPRHIEVKSGTLTKEQATFWKTVYEHGLGQFFYENNIDFRDLIQFPVTAEEAPAPIHFVPNRKKVMVPVGGGKDSAVTLELLRHADMSCTLLRMNTHPLIDQFVSVADETLLTIERSISPALFALNEQGALNGHVPVTAYLSFLSIVTCLLYGQKAAVFSCERSANIGSMMFYGMDVNHQWSKSLEFELLLQDYIRTYMTQDLPIFSLLRPLSELHIAKIFSNFPEYFPVTTSCNANWKLLEADRSRERWCAKCPKCAFVFAMLAAFIPKEQLLEMFGKNFFEEEALFKYYRQLLGLEGFKPFECVGTPEETQAAFLLIRNRGEFNDTPVMQLFLRDQLPIIADAESVISAALTPSTEHAIPGDYSTVLTGI